MFKPFYGIRLNINQLKINYVKCWKCLKCQNVKKCQKISTCQKMSKNLENCENVRVWEWKVWKCESVKV